MPAERSIDLSAGIREPVHILEIYAIGPKLTRVAAVVHSGSAALRDAQNVGRTTATG
jgi:hypothetical protein